MKLSFTLEDLKNQENQSDAARTALKNELYTAGKDAWCKFIEGEIHATMQSPLLREQRKLDMGLGFRLYIKYADLAKRHDPFTKLIAPMLIEEFNDGNPGFSMTALRLANGHDALEIIWYLD